MEIRIRDNGTGIPPEVKAKMFNPCFTTKPAGAGTGLGLSISHDIIDLTWLFWTKRCERIAWQRSFGHAEEEV